MRISAFSRKHQEQLRAVEKRRLKIARELKLNGVLIPYPLTTIRRHKSSHGPHTLAHATSVKKTKKKHSRHTAYLGDTRAAVTNRTPSRMLASSAMIIDCCWALIAAMNLKKEKKIS